MCDGYQPTGEEDHSGLDDEFLCEYVDGTMDPSVREVFEEYLRTDPALAEHVERLRHTRRLLCQYGCGCKAPRGLQARLRRELAFEMVRAQMPLFPIATSRLRAIAAFTSAMAMMLVVGMSAGVVFSEAERERPIRVASETSTQALFPEYQQASAIFLPYAISSYTHPSLSSRESVPGHPRSSHVRYFQSDSLEDAFLLRRSDVAP